MTEQDLRDYLEHLRAEGKSDAYCNRIIASSRAWFDYLAYTENSDRTNPALLLENRPKRHRSAVTLTDKEIAKLFEALRQQRPNERARNRAILRLFLETKLSVSDLCELRVKDLIPSSENPTGLVIRKARREPRSVPLSEAAQEALRGWLTERAALTRRLDEASDGRPKASQQTILEAIEEDEREYLWLIPANRKQGKRLGPQGVRFMLSQLANKAGLDKKVTPQVLRNSSASSGD